MDEVVRDETSDQAVLDAQSDKFLTDHFEAWRKGRNRLRRKKKVEAHKERVTEDWTQFQAKKAEVAKLIDKIDDENDPDAYLAKLEAAEDHVKSDLKKPDIKGGRKKLEELKNEVLIILRKQETVTIEKRDEFRDARVKEEITSLNLAIQGREDRIAEIKEEIKAAFGKQGALAARELLMQEYNEAKAQLGKLNDRKAFLTDYAKDKKGRAKNASKEAELIKRAELRNQRLAKIDSQEKADASNSLKTFGAKSERIQELAATDSAKEDAAAMHAKLSKLIQRDADMILHSARMYPDEPPITVISAEQFSVLDGMLDSAKRFLDKGMIAEAIAVLESVQKRHMGFRQVRAYTPDAKVEKPVDQEAIIKRQLDEIAAELVELWAAEVKDHDWYEKRHAGLSALHEKLVAGQFDDADTLAKDVTTLAEQIQHALKGAKSAGLAKSAVKAVDSAEEATADFLGKMYKTKEIKDASLVEDPSKTYTAEERKKLIPLDRLVRVPDLKSPTKFKLVQIDTKKDATTQEVTRRVGKDVPREMLDMLKKRADTLHMMKENADAGASDAVANYAKETERLVIEVSDPKNQKLFNDIEKTVKAIDKALNKKPVTEFAPTAVHKLKEDFEAFKDAWKTASPRQSHKDIGKLERRTDEVVERSGELKDLHKEFDKKTLELIKSSSKLMELVAGFDLMAKFKKTSPEWQKSEAGKLAKQQIKDAAAELKKGEKGLNTYHGEWKAQMDGVRQLLTNKSEAAIVEVEGKMKDLKHQVHKYERMMTGFTERGSVLDAKIKTMLDTREVPLASMGMQGEDMEAFLEKLGAEMAASQEGLAEDKTAKTDYEAAKKKADDHLSDIKSAIKKKGDKLQYKERYTDRRDAIRGQVKALDAQVKESLDYKLAKKNMEGHRDDAKELLDLVNGHKSSAKAKDEKTNIVSLVKQLRKRRSELIGAAKGLKAVIEEKGKDPVDDPDLPDDQKSDKPEHKSYAKQIGKIDAMMKQLDGKVASLQPVQDAGAKLDGFDASALTNREGKAIREEALAAFRTFEAAIDGDPILEVYRTNPFNSGKGFAAFRESMHSAQIAISTAVNPKRK